MFCDLHVSKIALHRGDIILTNLPCLKLVLPGHTCDPLYSS